MLSKFLPVVESVISESKSSAGTWSVSMCLSSAFLIITTGWSGSLVATDSVDELEEEVSVDVVEGPVEEDSVAVDSVVVVGAFVAEACGSFLTVGSTSSLNPRLISPWHRQV